MPELQTHLQAVSGVRRSEPSGKLRLTTSLSFAVLCLRQAIVEFQQTQPPIEVKLLNVDRSVDLVIERIDLPELGTKRLDEGVVERRFQLPPRSWTNFKGSVQTDISPYSTDRCASHREGCSSPDADHPRRRRGAGEGAEGARPSPGRAPSSRLSWLQAMLTTSSQGRSAAF